MAEMKYSCEKIQAAFHEFQVELTSRLKKREEAQNELVVRINALEKTLRGLEGIEAKLVGHQQYVEHDATIVTSLQERVDHLEQEIRILERDVVRAHPAEHQPDPPAHSTSEAHHREIEMEKIALPTSETLMGYEVEAFTPIKNHTDQSDAISVGGSTPSVPTDIPARAKDHLSYALHSPIAMKGKRHRPSKDEASDSINADVDIFASGPSKRPRFTYGHRASPVQLKDESLLSAFQKVGSAIEDGQMSEPDGVEGSDTEQHPHIDVLSSMLANNSNQQNKLGKNQGVFKAPKTATSAKKSSNEQAHTPAKGITLSSSKCEEDNSPTNPASAENKRAQLLLQFTGKKGKKAANSPPFQTDSVSTSQVGDGEVVEEDKPIQGNRYRMRENRRPSRKVLQN